MEKHQKNKFVNEIKGGDVVKEIFAVTEKEAVKPYAKGHMFVIKLRDKTGIISLSYFGSADKASVETVHNLIQVGRVVYVEANAKDYQGTMQITMNPPQQVIRVLEPGSYDLEHFVARTKKDIKVMKARLHQLIAEITDPDVRKLMEHVFSEKLVEKFCECSAAINRHHAFVGGLLEHSISLAEILLIVQKMHPELDRDYLVCGALLQDVGKTQEITGDIAFEFTTEGSLIGHVVLGAQMVSKAAEEMKTPKEKSLKLVHLVLSHHNELEYGSPIIPRFPEAAAVAHADQLDSKMQEFIEHFEEAKNSTTDETTYDRDLKRFLYLK